MIKNMNKLINKTKKIYNKYKIDMTLRELSPKTIEAYESDIKQWFIFILENQDNQCITELDEDDLTEFFYFCKSNGNNSRRMKRRMSTVGAFYKFLRKKKMIKENPMEFIDRPRKDVDVLEKLFLTKEQIEDMRIKLEELGDLQLQTYIEFSLSTLARVNAVSNIKWNMINFNERKVENVLEKEQRIVELCFSERVKTLLLKLKSEREKQEINCEYVFCTKYKGVYDKVDNGTLNEWSHKAGELININNCHCHTWRKSGATLLKNNGASLETVSKLLNHLSTDVSRRFYIKEDMKQIQEEKDKYEI